MNEIKPIETIYNGYRFRSRLEARWAVFFDELNIKYEYEPEGFEFDGEKYLPDFLLTDMNIYVEVKASNVRFIEHTEDNMVTFGNENSETIKYGKFTWKMAEKGAATWFVFGDPLDALLTKEHGSKGTNDLFCPCECERKALETDKKAMCSESSCIKNYGHMIPVLECEAKAMASGRVVFLEENYASCDLPAGLFPMNRGALKVLPYKWQQKISDFISDKYQSQQFIEGLVTAAKKTFHAAEKARQARFEHGEKPQGGR